MPPLELWKREQVIKLWKHQQAAVEKARERDNLALFFEMGTGKTATTIHILKERYAKAGRILRTLILCPPIVVENWRREFGIHSKVSHTDVMCLVGSGSKRELKLMQYGFDALTHVRMGRIFITNYEALLMKDLFAALEKWKPEILVCDESHKLKEHSTKRSKAARVLADNAQYKYILTGTPILNSPMDLYSQFRVLDGGETFGKNFFAFRNTYFYDKNAMIPAQRYFPNWVLKQSSVLEMKEKLEPASMSITKAECLDLPPMVRQTIHVELGKDQKRYYEQMKKDFITFVEDQACVAELAITKALRLQQILSGHLPVVDQNNEKEVIVLEDNPRAAAAKEILEEITPHSKILVWAVFKQDFVLLRAICDDLKIKYVEVHGEISAKQKMESVDSFNNDPKVRVFIGHPGSGGIGINLTIASYSLFYSRNFSLEQDLQADARNHRGGSEVHEKITRIDLVAKETIDELILECLKAKQNIGESIVREIARELKNEH